MSAIISASILSADFTKLGEEIKRIIVAGSDWIHFDVMDGSFVDNISYGSPVLKSVKNCTGAPFDVHLMVVNPEKHIETFAKAGADNITFHLEAADNPAELIDKIHALGVSAGVSVKPKTPVEKVFELCPKADMILVMTVEPGYGGQGFISETLEKISALRRFCDENGYDIHIEVDGGIDANTAKLVKNAGADVLVSGSYLFKAENAEEAVESLKF